MPDTPISIGSNRQLLLDHRLIDDLQDARQVLHQPVRRNSIYHCSCRLMNWPNSGTAKEYLPCRFLYTSPWEARATSI